MSWKGKKIMYEKVIPWTILTNPNCVKDYQVCPSSLFIESMYCLFDKFLKIFHPYHVDFKDCVDKLLGSMNVFIGLKNGKQNIIY